MPPHRFPDLGSRGPTAAVHDEEERLVLGALQLLLGKLLVPFQEVGGQHHVAGLSGRENDDFVSYPLVHLVNAVDISEGSSDGEHGADWGKCLMDFEHLQGRVQVVEGLRFKSVTYLYKHKLTC